MGRIVVVNFTSIDGIVQSPLAPDEDRDSDFVHGGWAVPYSDDTVAAFMREATVSAAGMLLGRRSYDILAAAWSQADEAEPAVAAMNRMSKYVVTSANDRLDWTPSHRVDGDVLTGVGALKQGVDGDLVTFGSSMLVRALAKYNLIDEYRLLLFPVILGAGKRMFGEEGHLAAFTLVSSTTTPTGVMILDYRRQPGAQP